MELLLSYLEGEAVPSGDVLVTIQKRPNFLSIYADDIDTVCHNGERLPYPQLQRAKTLDQWYENLVYTVQRMDKALGKLLELPDTTFALAADHGGMPYATAAFGVSREEARVPRGAELMEAIRSAGLDAYLLKSMHDTVPADAQALVMLMGTQAQLYYVQAPDAEIRKRVLKSIRSLAFIDRCLDEQQQQDYGSWKGFCDVYAVSRSPYFLGGVEVNEFLGGSHAGMEESIMHVFCAFYGKGIKQGLRVTHRTTLPQFAPTVCRLLSIDGPADAKGLILNEILEEK